MYRSRAIPHPPNNGLLWSRNQCEGLFDDGAVIGVGDDLYGGNCVGVRRPVQVGLASDGGCLCQHGVGESQLLVGRLLSGEEPMTSARIFQGRPAHAEKSVDVRQQLFGAHVLDGLARKAPVEGGGMGGMQHFSVLLR